MHNESNGLDRKLGLVPAVISGLGVTIGAGIYVLIAAGAGAAGNAVWISFVIAAIVAAFTALSYARLTRFNSRNAPEFYYVTLALNRRWGFLAGWLVIWSMIVSAAVVSLGFAGYLQNLVDLPAPVLAFALIALSTLVIMAGTRQSMALIGLLTAVTVFGLLAVVVIGFPYLGEVTLTEAPQGYIGVLSAAALVFFAFLGFETMANLADEMRNPEKDLPRAMLLVLAISALFYVLVAVTAVSVIGWEVLSQSNAPLTDVVNGALGSDAGTWITIVSLAATGSTAFFLILSASRAVWAMSCAGVLPLPFCSIGKSRTPWIAILGVGALTSLFVPIQSVETVALFTNVAVFLAFIGINIATIKLANRMGAETKTNRIIYGRIIPTLGIITCFWLAINTGAVALIFGGLTVVAGLVYYHIFGIRSTEKEA